MTFNSPEHRQRIKEQSKEVADYMNRISPPPDLIEDWIEIAKPLPQRPPDPGELAALAARWGSDQELEACCEWLINNQNPRWAAALQEGRRPKPSLKEQSIALIDKIQNNKEMWQTDDLDVVRRALESLPD